LADKYQQEFQITRPQWRVIAVLGETPKLSAIDITEETAMDKVAVSRAVNALTTAKLIKQSQDKTDGRRTLLSLTAKGARMYSAIIPIALNYEEQLLNQLTKAEQETFLKLLTKLDGRDAEI
jgi:DNA-binding MarR family transcriptional regulator